MPKVDERKEATLRREIRLELGLNPLISSRELQEKLQRRLNHPVDRHFILKLVHKINVQVQFEGDNIELRGRVNQIRERTGAMIERLLKIAFWQWEYLQDGVSMPSNMEAIMAMQTIMKMDVAIFEAESNSGLFKRTVGNPEEYVRALVNPEAKRVIAGVLKTWGMPSTDYANQDKRAS